MHYTKKDSESPRKVFAKKQSFFSIAVPKESPSPRDRVRGLVYWTAAERPRLAAPNWRCSVRRLGNQGAQQRVPCPVVGLWADFVFFGLCAERSKDKVGKKVLDGISLKPKISTC